MIDEYEHPRHVEEPPVIDGKFVDVKDIIESSDINHAFDAVEVISNAQD